MILHAIYDHGRIELLDEDLPDIRTEVEIEIEEEYSISKKDDFIQAIEKLSWDMGKKLYTSRDDLHDR